MADTPPPDPTRPPDAADGARATESGAVRAAGASAPQAAASATPEPTPARTPDAPPSAQTDPHLALDLATLSPPAAGPPPPSAPTPDPALEQYLADVDLEALDLSEVELELAPAASLPTLVGAAGITFVALVAALNLPSTALYQLHGTGKVLWWLSLVALGIGGAVTYRHRGALAEPRLQQLLRTGVLPPRPAQRPRRPLPGMACLGAAQAHLARHRRTYMACSIVVLAGCIAFVLPHEAEWAGGTYSTAWFVAVAVAMGCGLLLGRFILAQAEATPLPGQVKPLGLPPYLRWLNLALLLAGGVVVTFGGEWFGLGGPGSASEFSLAGLSLALGIGGAIWLARRFDELEAKWRDADAAPAAKAPPLAPLAPRQTTSWDLGETGQMGKKP